MPTIHMAWYLKPEVDLLHEIRAMPATVDGLLIIRKEFTLWPVSLAYKILKNPARYTKRTRAVCCYTIIQITPFLTHDINAHLLATDTSRFVRYRCVLLEHNGPGIGVLFLFRDKSLLEMV
jgi:hypothetical protein